MGNIIDYARTETRSFEALPFREADALVLAQLSYDEVPECVLLLDDLVANTVRCRRVRSNSIFGVRSHRCVCCASPRLAA